MKAVTQCMDTKPAIVGMCVFTLGLTIWSMTEVISAYILLDARVNDYSFILDTWEMEPLLNVTVVSGTSSCPSGYSSLTHINWPGVTAGPCVCPRGASQNGEDESSGSGTCDTNQTKAGCETVQSLPLVPLEEFVGTSQFCGKRGGEAAMFNTGGGFRTAKERPTPTGSKNKCGSGYKPCGRSNETYPGVFCFPKSSPCPVTDLKVASIASLQSNSEISEVHAIPGTSSPQLGLGVVRGGDGTSLPIVDWTIAIGGDVCAGTEEGSVGVFYEQTTGNKDYSMDTGPSTCVFKDKRFDKIGANVDTSDWLQTNFADGKPCTNSPNKAIVSVSSCDSSDTYCTRLNDQGQCDYLNNYAGSGDDNTEWKVMHEIKWDPDCFVNRVGLLAREEPVMQLRSLQLAIVIINVIAGVLNVFVQFSLVYNRFDGDVPCIPGEGEQEENLIKHGKTTADACLKLAKIIPELVLIVLVGAIHAFFSRLASANCSDGTTNETMSFLSTSITAALEANQRAVAVDFVLLLYSIYGIITIFICSHEAETKRDRKQNTFSATSV